MPRSRGPRCASFNKLARIAGILLALAAGVSVAAAQENFYKGKTLRLVVGNPPGGGTGAYMPLIARYLKNHIAGAPNVVVENMVGAGTLVAANYVANVGAQDGTIVGVIGAAIPFSPMLGVKEAQFDPLALHWMPSPTSDVSGLTVWHTVPVSSIEDARKHELVLASANPFSTSSFYARIITAVTGLHFKLIYGYNGVEAAFLAMEKGEVEGHPSASRAGLLAAHPDWIRDNKVKVLIQWGRGPSPELPDTPFLRDLARNDEDRTLVDVAVAPLAIGWPIFVGPKVPESRVAELRKAFLETYTDKDLLADAARQGNLEFSPNPMTGEEVQALIAKTYGAPAAVLDRLRALYQGAQ